MNSEQLSTKQYKILPRPSWQRQQYHHSVRVTHLQSLVRRLMVAALYELLKMGACQSLMGSASWVLLQRSHWKLANGISLVLFLLRQVSHSILMVPYNIQFRAKMISMVTL